MVTAAGPVTVGFPTNSVTLRASATDPAGLSLAFTWTQVSGPVAASFSAPNLSNTVVMASVSGAYVFRITVFDGLNASLADSTVTFTADPNTVTFQATNGVISAPFTIQNGYIVQNLLTTTVADGGRAAYAFGVPVHGNYVVMALVNAADDSANSFFLNIDAELVDPDMIWDVAVASDFEWQVDCWRGAGTTGTSELCAKFFNLEAGSHTLIIRCREAGLN